MAFTPKTFVPMSSQANSSAPRMFSYATADILTAVDDASYFDDAAALTGGLGLKTGDAIWATSTNATAGSQILQVAVAAATGVVTVVRRLTFV